MEKNAPPTPDRTRLRPELRAMLEDMDLVPAVAPAERDPVAERAAAAVAVPALWGRVDEIARVETIPAEGSTPALRWYHPADAVGTVLYMHGGGWMAGDLDTHDGVSRMLANVSGCDVIAVDYRRAPEQPFPAARDDCMAALEWVRGRQAALRGIEGGRVVVCGDSAGGNLAAVLARRARDRGIHLAGQVLLYPAVDGGFGRLSYAAFEEGFFLSTAEVRWMLANYAPGELANPDVAPIRATDLSGLPPCYLATADHDPLRDDGRAYATQLIGAGNEVTYEEWRGVVHGFWVMRSITPASGELVRRVGAWIAARVARNPPAG